MGKWMRAAAIAAVLGVGLLMSTLAGVSPAKAGVSLAGCFIDDGD